MASKSRKGLSAGKGPGKPYPAGKHQRKHPSTSGKGIAPLPVPKPSFSANSNTQIVKDYKTARKRMKFKYLPPRRVIVADPPSGNANLVSSNAPARRRVNPKRKFPLSTIDPDANLRL